MSIVNRVIDEAYNWIGYLEKKSNSSLADYTANAGDKNYTIFAKQYYENYGDNFQGQPWCAMFISCVLANVLGLSNQENIMPHFAYCPTGVNNFKKSGHWYKSPQIGDIIFFKDSIGIACHVGIVMAVDSTHVYTIEGNTSCSAGVVANGGAVAKKCYTKDYNRILGYGRPDYSIAEEVQKVKRFNDITGHYAEKHINELSEMGIINGTDNGKFSPDEKISRADAAIMVRNAIRYVTGK